MAHVEDAVTAIERRFNTGWTTTKKRFWTSNVPFEIPDAPYVALQVEEFSSQQASFGSGVQLHRYAGNIILQILVKERTGSKLANQYASQLSDLFRSAQFSYLDSGLITCFTPVARTIGVQDGWFQVNVSVEYRRDKIH